MSDVREEIWYRVARQIEEQICYRVARQIEEQVDSHMRIRKQLEDRVMDRARDLLWQPGEGRIYVDLGRPVSDQADEETP